MCGILFTENPNISRPLFERALGRMSHRGPDVCGRCSEINGRQLGHNRLKILDLDDRSNQPFISRDGRYVMVYNGEIYNFQALVAHHEIEPQTTGDTEVLLELFARLGPGMLDELNGMFALVILDQQEGTVFAARDRLGIKPLYYCESRDGLTFASEIEALLDLVDEGGVDAMGLRQYRKLRAFFNGRTLYKNIKMFPAGHFLWRGKLSAYWQFPRGKQSAPDDEELRALIEDAVHLRCISDVPVGSYLSGGLDSTIVAALSRKPDTWTVGFAEHNEFPYARIAAKSFGNSHNEVLVGHAEFVDLARGMICKRREPLSVPNEVLLYRMTREVKAKNTVVLSGEGADELFFGYDRIFRWASQNRWDIREFDEHYSYGSHEDLEVIEDAVAPFMKYGSCLNIVAAFFQIAHLHGLLRRLDNATMLCSVEARVPFVDHRLVERLAGTAFSFRMENRVVKSPLKRVFRDIVPEDVLQRQKVGFPVPLAVLDLGPGATPTDAWLGFNLMALGIERTTGVKTGSCPSKE